ncbi:MAG: siroheme synthase, partial [Alphaproteobacteria bacterium]|nr:siroheme synthase [Alphaproteobacteria bacterium]
EAFETGGALDPLQTLPMNALDKWIGLRQPLVATMPVEIILTSTDPDDLTLGQARTLAQADMLWHTPDVPASIVARVRTDAPRMICDALPDNARSGVFIRMAKAR